MSQKTIYPGMPSPGSGQQYGSSNPFSQFPDTQSPFNGTVYPHSGQTTPQAKSPIMGFFYSVSRTSFGEYWPLYEGPNKIGRNDQNTVVLQENSVSDYHAVLTIRRMKKGNENVGVSVFLQDNNSMLGTMLNGETLDYNPRECKNGDIITVGANYELYLILVDADAIGLTTKPDFSSSEMPVISDTPDNNPWTVMDKGTIGGNAHTQRPKTTIYMPGNKK